MSSINQCIEELQEEFNRMVGVNWDTDYFTTNMGTRVPTLNHIGKWVKETEKHVKELEKVIDELQLQLEEERARPPELGGSEYEAAMKRFKVAQTQT